MRYITHKKNEDLNEESVIEVLQELQDWRDMVKAQSTQDVYNVTLSVSGSTFIISQLADSGLGAVEQAKRELMITLPWVSEFAIKLVDVVKQGK